MKGRVEEVLRRGPGRRWNVALLNLSGLSLGFFYLRRFKAGLVHSAVTVVLLWIAGAGAVASAPGVWLVVFVLWLGWMALHAWRIERRLAVVPRAGRGVDGRRLDDRGDDGPLTGADGKESPVEGTERLDGDADTAEAREPAPTRLSWTVTAVGAALLIALVVSVLAMRSAADGEFDAALAAHEVGDCVAAEGHYDRIDARYQLSFSGVLPLAAEDRRQCGQLVEARETAEAGDYETTVAAYDAYLAHDDPPAAAVARLELSEIHLAQAASLSEEVPDNFSPYTEAIGIYALLAAEFGDTEAGQGAPDAVQAMYERATAAASAEPCTAIDAFDYFVRGDWDALAVHKDAAAELTAAAVQDAAARLPGLLFACGSEAYGNDLRDEAEALLLQLVADFPDDPNAAAAQAMIDAIVAEREREAEEERQREAEEAAEEEAERQREAEEAAEQARIDEIRSEIDEASSGGDNLADPDSAGSTGGSMELKLGNSSGYTLEILYDGPETGSFTIGGCSDCSGQCGDGWAVWETVSLPAGEYEMVVKATDDYVTPYYGVWGLDSGTAYEECYYIESY